MEPRVSMAQFDFAALARDGFPVRHVAGGDKVFRAGDRGDCLFIVLSGRVSIAAGGMVVEKVGPGGIFGEMALLDGHERSATVTASEAVELACLDEAAFLDLISRHPRFALQVMRVLSARIRRANQSL